MDIKKNIGDLHLKEKLNTAKLKAGIKAKEARQWVSENKELVIGVATVTIPAAIGLGGKVVSRNKVAKEEKRRATDIYDPSSGIHWNTKKKLTEKQKLEIDRRHRSGESYGEILNSMKLLKK